MNKVLQFIAVLTHPVFLPIYSLGIYYPLIAKYDSTGFALTVIWIFFVYLLLPLVFFKKIRSLNLAHPSLAERKTIYKAYSLVNLGFALVSVFLMPEYIGFYLGLFIAHLLLFFMAFIELKASWHTMAWSYLLGASLMIWYNYHMNNSLSITLSILSVLILVWVVRCLQKAHTQLELVVGSAIGLLSAVIILFIY